MPNPGCRTPGCRTPVPPSRGALSPGLSSRVALNRGALKRGSLNPRASEPGAAGTRALNRGAPNLRHRGRRQRGRRCHARTPATPNLSARNAGDAEPGEVEPREAGPACVWTGPAGQDGSWWERAGAPRQKPSRAPERGPVRSTGTRLRALVFHVEHRADGRVPTDRPRRAAVAPAVSAVRDLGDRPDAPASHETGSRSSSFWSGTGRGAHLNRSSPGSRRAGIEGTAVV